MACSQLLVFWHRNLQTIIFLLLLFISGLTHVRLTAEGRRILKTQTGSMITQRKNEEKMLKMRSLIGSRPPRCEGRCRNCGPCEAVQVPIVPNLKHQKTSRIHQLNAIPKLFLAYSREGAVWIIVHHIL
ncbi:EPIDERMAL PATTERNING FACTOR-like protein 2 isoform X2 [Solanum dulcamara]|uniref:EPIDERMAL PATTERNING FACTOR-like protein 2 isoform X2 n=1 Tax=Solanum dulcamara TaxID=45834 RepID=UPI002484FE13|nr:EPIDERMAL PATTERNING FACTOR-like protein 2 isoform X2 [Solanum dulcamara]